MIERLTFTQSLGCEMRYFVVEPLDEGGYQVWRVRLEPLLPYETPDEDGVVTATNGDEYTWRWKPVGEPLDTHRAAKEEAYRYWYSIKEKPACC